MIDSRLMDSVLTDAHYDVWHRQFLSFLT